MTSTADDIEVGCVICKCHPDCEECQATMFSADGPPLMLCDCDNDDGTVTCVCSPNPNPQPV